MGRQRQTPPPLDPSIIREAFAVTPAGEIVRRSTGEPFNMFTEFGMTG